MDPKPNSTVIVGAVRFGNDMPLSLVAGPCALESKVHALEMATIANAAGKVYKDTLTPDQFVPSVKEPEEPILDLTDEQKSAQMTAGLLAMLPNTIDMRSKRKGKG